MRSHYLLILLLFCGCGSKPSEQPMASDNDIPKPGSIKKPENSNGDLVKAFQLLELCDKKQYAQVLPEAEQFVKKYPYEGKGWLALATAQHGLKKYDLAKQSYGKAIAFYEPNGYLALASLYYDTGNNPKAIEVFRVAQKEYNEPNYGAIQLTRLYLMEKKYPEALDVAKQCFEFRPRDPALAANLALAYHFNKDLVNRDKYMKLAKEKRLSAEDEQGFENIMSGKAKVKFFYE